MADVVERLPERIWVERDEETNEKRWYSVQGMGVEYIRADSAALSQAGAGGGVVVQTLAWNEYETDGEIDRWDAETVAGTFYEIGLQFDGYHLSHDHLSQSLRPFDSPDEAKAAAQADYSARILAALASSPSAGAAPICAMYTNWRGERAPRTFIPRRVFFGSNEWHPEPQVLIEATDCVTGELRTFAASGFATPPAPVQTASVEAVADLIDSIAKCHSENAMDRAFLDNSDEIAAAVLKLVADRDGEWSCTVNRLEDEIASLAPAPTQGDDLVAWIESLPREPTPALRAAFEKYKDIIGEPTPSSPVSSPSPAGGVREALAIARAVVAETLDQAGSAEAAELVRDGQCDGWADVILAQRAAAAALAAPASEPAGGGVREALRALYEWYDRDGSVGGASEVFEAHRSALFSPASSPAEAEALPDGVEAAAIELLSHLKLNVMERLEPHDADMLHDRMFDLTRALSPAPAQAGSGDAGEERSDRNPAYDGPMGIFEGYGEEP